MSDSTSEAADEDVAVKDLRTTGVSALISKIAARRGFNKGSLDRLPFVIASERQV